MKSVQPIRLKFGQLGGSVSIPPGVGYQAHRITLSNAEGGYLLEPPEHHAGGLTKGTDSGCGAVGHVLALCLHRAAAERMGSIYEALERDSRMLLSVAV